MQLQIYICGEADFDKFRSLVPSTDFKKSRKSFQHLDIYLSWFIQQQCQLLPVSHFTLNNKFKRRIMLKNQKLVGACNLIIAIGLLFVCFYFLEMAMN